MNEPENGIRWQVKDHGRRIDTLERYDLGVIDNRLKNVESEIHDIKKAQVAQTKILWTIAVALIVAALTLAVSISTGTLGA